MRISIVTITYNAANVLQPTLDSVRMQDHDDLEHVIIDGASKDATVDMARSYQAASEASGCGHEVVVVSEPDKGLYDAMNKGLRRVTGEYVCFLNAGDRLPAASTISSVVEAAQLSGDGDQPAVVYGDTDIIGPEGEWVGHRHLSPPDHLSWRSFKHGMLVCHQAFYARTDIARQVEYDTRYRYSADVDWCIRVMRGAEKAKAPLVRVGGVIALYQQEGQTTLHHSESLRERFDVMRRHYGLFTTSAMHVWFAVRSAVRSFSRKH